jgi:Ca-activated chloride channel homolog
MKQRSVAEQLGTLEAPKPRAEARLAARNAALLEFSRVRDGQPAGAQPARPGPKGFWSRFRLSRNETRDGSAGMKWGLVSRTAVSAAASGGIAVFAIAVMWPMFRDRSAPSILPAETEATVRLQQPVSGLIADPVPDEPPEQYLPAQSTPAYEAKASEPLPPPPAAAPADSYRHSRANEIIVRGELRALQASQNSASAPVLVDGEMEQPSAQGAFSFEGADKLKKEQAPGRVIVTKSAPAAPGISLPYFEAAGDDRFEHFEVNPIRRVSEEPWSTFSVDVDTASYSFARRLINEGRLPPKDAVRVEEMINYFDYAWPKPESRKTPFAATVAVGDSPWAKGRKLVHIGIKGYDIDRGDVPDANLVFLIDVSGSMNSPDKLPLAVSSMKLLLQRLKPTDTVGIVVYAGAAGTVLEPTAVKNEDRIMKALDSLEAGGSTAGAEGIELAYQLAEKSFRKGGVNRVLLATDGDFNVGIDDTQALKSFIERKREKGIFLSVLGFGQGNYRDELAQALAQNGNGVAAYIDTIGEARKVLVEQATGSLFTIAKDVKLQVEFNPDTVAEYRLVGYETRALEREDFNNDKVDAGDVGAGHTVTALYEITPVGSSAVSVDEPHFAGNARRAARGGDRNAYGFLKIRYKLPDSDTSTLVSQPIPLETLRLSPEIRREVDFSTAVAGFAQLLKGGAYTGLLSYDDVIEQAQRSRGEDRNGYRAEFIELVRRAAKAKGM